MDSRSEMTGKQSTAKTAQTPSDKKTGGGTAVGGGINFQAAITTIVGVHILSGTALNWFEGVCRDKPVAVWAESEGPGDDLRVELEDNVNIEVQAKKGLVRGAHLWAALQRIADAIHQGHLPYGVLAVASDSSNTICEDLAKDIKRLGQGRTDHLTDIGADWARQLSEVNIPAQTVCRCMRIRVIHALSAEETSISAAKDILRRVCARDEDADAAWNCLYRQAVLLIEERGRWTLPDLIRLLGSSNIAVRENDLPASVMDRYSRWVIDTNSHFSITGINRKIPNAHLLPMHLEKRTPTEFSSEDASSALERYHKGPERKSSMKEFDSIGTARFKHLAVVVAGPGLGKSTMLKELARQYAHDGYLVLRVALKPIAAAMQQGGSFSELLLTRALDGSGLLPHQIRSATGLNRVILADGLDECGSAHHEVAEQINKYAVGHPGTRIVVTTRPIGYETAELSHWTHYNLLPPRKEEGANNLQKLVSAVLISDPSRSSAGDLSQHRPGKIAPSDAISISPQLLGMSASLICLRRAVPTTRLGLYTELISLFEKLPANTPPEQTDLCETVLDIIGWVLISSPLIAFDELISRTATLLAPMMETAPLALKRAIRLAITHWESVGLVEKVFHQGTALLTFIHKTFCEFVASRFLVNNRHDLKLIEEVIDHPDRQEVLNFAVGLGLADTLIKVYLTRHAAGCPGQLQPALLMLGNRDVDVSEASAQELIQQSFKAVEDGATDKFSIGLALSDVSARTGHLVESLAVSKLDATDPAIKLVAWATAIRCDSSHCDAVTLSAVFAELLKQVEPIKTRDILDKKDRGDRDLLQLVGLAALKAQPDDSARSFAEHELQDKKLLTIGFKFKVNDVLRSRGIEELPLPMLDLERGATPATLTYAGPSWTELSAGAFRSIAKAFANDRSATTITQSRPHAFLQFAGLIHSSEFWNKPASDIGSWEHILDEPAVQSTIKAVAQLIPLDQHALAEEARDLIDRLDTNSIGSIFTFLPTVDIDPPIWENAAHVPINRVEVMRGLLHPSVWINWLAAGIFHYLPMERNELEQILRKAKDDSLGFVVDLIQHHHFEEMQPMLLQRLSEDASGDVSYIFEVLREFEAEPSTALVKTTVACLCSTDGHTVEAAAELLGYWLDQGVVIDADAVAKAVEHWGGRDSWKNDGLSNTPVLFLNGLFDRIKAVP